MKILAIDCAFDNFAYLLGCETTTMAAVIDPTEGYPVLREAKRRGLELTMVYCTHHHHDHVGGIEELLAEKPDLLVYGFHGDVGRIPAMNRPLQGGDVVHLGSLRGQVLHVPGHTSGSLCYLFGENLFTGDTLFGGGCGRLFEGTVGQMYHSLNVVIGRLDPATHIFYGHDYTERNLLFAQTVEPDNTAIEKRLAHLRADKTAHRPLTPSTLQVEQATNPFLRCQKESIRQRVCDNHDPCTDLEVFGMLRQLRDTFQA